MLYTRVNEYEDFAGHAKTDVGHAFSTGRCSGGGGGMRE